jgi:hypothetical protein
MTKKQIVIIANSLEMFRDCFFSFRNYLSFVHYHLEFVPKKATIKKIRLSINTNS